MAEYDAWADYYDLIHQGLPGETEFYVGHAVKRGEPVLELGCGTGRISLPMAMSGLHVTGIDMSAAMLDVCRYKQDALGTLPGKLELICADMCDFTLEQKFSLVLMPYRTIMHLLTYDDQLACLNHVREHLADNGEFILNLWRPRASQIARMSGTGAGVFRSVGRYPFEDEETGCVTLIHSCATHCDENLRLLAEEHVLQEVDGRGSVLHTAILPLVRTWFTRRELEALFRESGFSIKALFGNFECQPFTAASTEMVWVLGKA